jgi:hypothetical protein
MRGQTQNKLSREELDALDTLLITSGYTFATHKPCRRCKKIKSRLAFARLTRSPDSLKNYCRTCAKLPVNTVTRTEKECIRCHFVHPIEDFYVKKDAIDGRQSFCTHCGEHNTTIYTTRYKQATTRPMVKWRYCPRCKSTKKATDFSKQRKSLDGYTYECRACALKYSRTQGRKARQSAKHAHRTANPPWTYTQAQIDATQAHRLATIDDPCDYCGQRTDTMHWTHPMPVTKGGPDLPENIVRACTVCSKGKHNRCDPCFIADRKLCTHTWKSDAL